jgi:hypothetical protein
MKTILLFLCKMLILFVLLVGCKDYPPISPTGILGYPADENQTETDITPDNQTRIDFLKAPNYLSPSNAPNHGDDG